MQLVESSPNQQTVGSTTVFQRVSQIWMLRILLDLNGYRRVGLYFNIDAVTLSNILELELDPGEEAEDSFVPMRLAERLRELESQGFQIKGTFTENLKCLGRALALSAVEEQVLEFLLLMHKNSELGEVTDLIGDDLTLGDLVDSLSVILAIPREEIGAVLQPDAILFASGLLRIESMSGKFRAKVMVYRRLIDILSLPREQSLGIIARFVDRAPPPKLMPQDFEDYRSDYNLLKRYLKGALVRHSAGCNILIYGLPGVGKTQLVRTICQELGIDLFEVASQDRCNDPLSASERLSAFQLSQKLLSKRESTSLLFDEIEEVFPSMEIPWLSGRQQNGSNKSWINQQLETNQVPVFWLANDVSQLDPAYIRRFDIVLELRPMRAKARAKLIKKACRRAGVKPGRWISKAAGNQNLSPALIENITRVMAQTRLEDDESGTLLFEKLANGTLHAMGLPLLSLVQGTPTLPYKVNLLNADTDLETLTKGLGKNMQGRLLCYGPPGTGKTAFAKHLAEALELPLMQFRASDILGPYVGMTEQKLAGAFQQAREESAIMLLDEIDSLLRSRDSANQSWEVTQVNELLMQMENYGGILIACTNHKSTLDRAAARRFDLKIGFGYIHIVTHKYARNYPVKT